MAFRYLPNLEYLSLKGNDLHLLKSGFFKALKASPLTELNLAFTKLATISSDAFDPLTSLKHLDLTGNPLLTQDPKNMLPAALKHLTLTDLGLATVNAQAIPFRTLRVLRKTLKRLNLNGNYFENLGTLGNILGATFPHMPALEELTMFDCNIQDLHETTLENLSNLRFLDVGGNNFTHLFTGLVTPTMEVLDVSNQCFRRNQDNPETRGLCVADQFIIDDRAFSSKNKLRVLKLSDMPLNAVIQRNTFVGLRDLEEMWMDGTEVTTLNTFALSTMKKLKWLHLDRNENMYGFSEDTFTGMDELEYMDISYSSKVLSEASDDDLDMKPMDNTSWTSTRPPSLRAMPPWKLAEVVKHFKELRTLKARCSLIEGCEGWYTHETVHKEMMERMPNLEQLDLSENALSAWHEPVFAGNPKLKILELQRNNIIYITEVTSRSQLILA